MKRAIVLVIFIVVGFAGGVLWMKKGEATRAPAAHAEATPAAPAEEEEAAPQVSHDTNGNVVISMSDETQGDLGIQVKSAVAYQMSPELKGYGKVLDPAPLAGLATELATAQAAATASSAELARLKTLEGQGNASARALQAAEAAAQRDQLAVHSAMERLVLSWGKPLVDQKDLPALVKSLVALEAALVRVDLPVGDTLKAQPTGARIATLSGQTTDAEFLGSAPNVDPQMQGRGFLFLLRPNSLRLTVGESLVGYIKVPGEQMAGAIIPRDALVRAEGAGWVYVLNSAGDAFTRVQVALDHPLEAGWFVTKGVSVGEYVVVVGAQQLLSFETKKAGGEE